MSLAFFLLHRVFLVVSFLFSFFLRSSMRTYFHKDVQGRIVNEGKIYKHSVLLINQGYTHIKQGLDFLSLFFFSSFLSRGLISFCKGNTFLYEFYIFFNFSAIWNQLISLFFNIFCRLEMSLIRKLKKITSILFYLLSKYQHIRFGLFQVSFATDPF